MHFNKVLVCFSLVLCCRLSTTIAAAPEKPLQTPPSKQPMVQLPETVAPRKLSDLKEGPERTPYKRVLNFISTRNNLKERHNALNLAQLPAYVRPAQTPPEPHNPVKVDTTGYQATDTHVIKDSNSKK